MPLGVGGTVVFFDREYCVGVHRMSYKEGKPKWLIRCNNKSRCRSDDELRLGVPGVIGMAFMPGNDCR